MKKPNPVNVIFKDKVHFDVQNSIICLLAAQVSNNEKAMFEQIKKAPSTKDVTISKRLEKLKRFNNKNNNDGNDNDGDSETVIFLVSELCLCFHQKIMNLIVNLILITKN